MLQLPDKKAINSLKLAMITLDFLHSLILILFTNISLLDANKFCETNEHRYIGPELGIWCKQK